MRRRKLPAPITKNENKPENRILDLRMELYTKRAALRFEYELKRDEIIRKHEYREYTNAERAVAEANTTEQYKNDDKELIQQHDDKIKEIIEQGKYNSEEYFSLQREIISAKLRNKSRKYYSQFAEALNKNMRIKRKSLKACVEN